MSEKEIQAGILKYLKAKGICHFRMIAGRSKLPGGGWYDACPAGTADIVIFLPESLPIWIECKRAKGGKQKEIQLQFEGEVRELGHSYYLVRSLEDVLEVIFP